MVCSFGVPNESWGSIRTCVKFQQKLSGSTWEGGMGCGTAWTDLDLFWVSNRGLRATARGWGPRAVGPLVWVIFGKFSMF